MSQANVERYHRVTAALNRHDIDAALAFIDPDVQFIARLVEVDGGASYRGHDGMRNWWESLFGVFPDFNLEIADVRAFGELTVAQVRMNGQGMASEAPTAQTSWAVIEWRGGKIIWMRNCQSEAEALEAAGLGVGDVGE